MKLVTDLEQKLIGQASDTELMLKRAFSGHEKSVSGVMSLSEKRISGAIAAHTEGMNAAIQSHRMNVIRMVRQTWLTIAGITFLILATGRGVLCYQGTLIASNLEEIFRQNDALPKTHCRSIPRKRWV